MLKYEDVVQYELNASWWMWIFGVGGGVGAGTAGGEGRGAVGAGGDGVAGWDGGESQCDG